jgi:hypothetical protein
MRPVKLVILAGIGILALTGVAVVGSLMDYVSHPAVSVAHVPPVVTPIAPEPADTAPAPLPTTPVTAVPVDQSSAAAPPAPAQQQAQAPTARQSDALARFLQQLQQRRHRPPRGTG